MKKRLFAMKYLRLSQSRFGLFSHKNNNAYDLVGKNSGTESFYATYRYRVVAIYKFNHTNGTGFANTVHFYDEENDVTLAFTHADYIDDLKVGTYVKLGTSIYKEGTTGRATGPHIHLEIGKGLQIKKQNINGLYRLINQINIEDYFYIDESITVLDTKGLNFEFIKKGEESMEEIVTRINLNDKEWDYKLTLDGNKFGLPYDKTTMNYFSDKELEKQGYEKYVVINGSIFYSYDGATYAEGVEKSRGINNQPLDMQAVSKFNETMSVGFTYDGFPVFDKQKNIIKNLNNYYGAYTGMFGVMKDGKLCEWGKEIESQRNSMYSNTSGRTVLGYDSINKHLIIISIKGNTGSSGVRGNELYSICKKHGCTDAVCNDGGGSVFLIHDNKNVISTSRAVKNAIIVYRKRKLELNKNVEDSKDLEIAKLKKENKKLKEALIRVQDVIKEVL